MPPFDRGNQMVLGIGVLKEEPRRVIGIVAQQEVPLRRSSTGCLSLQTAVIMHHYGALRFTPLDHT